MTRRRISIVLLVGCFLGSLAAVPAFSSAVPAVAERFSPAAAGESPVKVILEGRELAFEVPPRTIDGRVMVPMRAIFEAMGASLDWDQSTQTATAVKGSTTVVAQIGNNTASVNGIQQILEVPPAAIDGRTLAPLRFVAEAFGYTARWDGDSQTANIDASSTTPLAAEMNPGPEPEAADTASSMTTSTVANTVGNTPGNVVNNGMVCQQGDWIYFQDYCYGCRLYKVRTDGSGRQLIIDEPASNINVTGDWIYYTGSNDVCIYKIRTDGSQRTRVNNDWSDCITVSGEWIYYQNVSDWRKLYRISTDGSRREMLTGEAAESINLAGEWLYYISVNQPHFDSLQGIYSMKTDGSELHKIADDVWDPMIVADGWVYYLGDNFNICRVKTDGSEFQKLSDDWAESFNIAGDWIYYGNNNDGGTMYKVHLDGRERQKVNDVNTDAICVLDGWIYYVYDETGQFFVRMRTDGTGQEDVTP